MRRMLVTSCTRISSIGASESFLSQYERNSMCAPPIAFIASFNSPSRPYGSSSGGQLPPHLPWSPRVALSTWTSTPASRYFANVPAAKNVSSSGCAPINRIRFNFQDKSWLSLVGLSGRQNRSRRRKCIAVMLAQVLHKRLLVVHHRPPPDHLVHFLLPRSRRKPLRFDEPEAMAQLARLLELLPACVATILGGDARHPGRQHQN